MKEISLHLKYLAVSDGDLRWGLAVHSVGYQDIGPGEPYPPVGHPSRYLFSSEHGRILQEYQLLYITRGRGTFRSASLPQPHILEQGSLFLLFPGEWHSYAPDPATGWKEYWIGFDGARMKDWVEKGFFSPQRPLVPLGLHADIVGLYNEAIDAAMAQETGFQQLLGGIVDHMLSLSYFHARREQFSENGDKINRAKILIAENFQSVTPESLARELCMGYSSFRKIFKDYTGFSPAKYIQEVRMGKVKEALTNSTLPVKEVAYNLGYENYDYFFTAFRRLTGMTPGEYRNMTQGITSH